MSKNNDRYSYFEDWSTKLGRHLAQPGTLSKLSELGQYEEIGIGEAVVRETPIVSYAYGHCKGLLLSNKDHSRIAHSHLLLRQDPDEFLDYMLSRMGSKPSDLRAMAITDEHFEHIEQACRRYGIENLQVNQFDGEQLRDVIAIPTLNQVLIYGAGETQPNRFSF